MHKSPLQAATLEKIANTLLFLGEKIKPLKMTAALKFVYLLDEESIKRYGIPFFGLDYRVWQYGPVSAELYSELNKPTRLANQLEVRKTENGSEVLFKKSTFDDSEFSDNEIDLLKEIRDSYWTMFGFEMVSMTHEENGLWYKTASRHHLLDKNGKMTKPTSQHELDFAELLRNDPQKLNRFLSYKEFKAI